MEVKELSVFFPLANEEGNVEETVKRAIKVLEKINIKYEILLINDGSKDKTGEIVDRLAKENPKISAIHHRENLGYGEALKSGFYGAKYDTIVYTDGDGQFDFTEVSKFLEKIKDYDLIIGYRIKRQDPFFRILFKQGWKSSLFTFFGLTLKDIDCGFKMVKRSVLEKIPKLESTRGAMINAEIVIKAKKVGFSIGQVGVNHYPRLSGKPTGASIKVIIKSYLDLFKLWWTLKDQKPLFILLCLVLILAAVLRFYKLGEYMTFLGDEGRDALIMKKMLSGDFPLIGPPTSVGNIYLGPLYYYMMFIPMSLTNLNPVSAAGMNAIIGVLIVGFVYYLSKIWFGRIAALAASFLYAISPVTIVYSRSSWNPNPTPFFALLGIYSLYRLNKGGNFKWLILTGASFAAALQMHYLSLILLPVGVVLWVHEVCYRTYKVLPIKNLFSGTFMGIATFIFVMLPLVLFDFKHNFLNYRAITELLTGGGAVKANIFANILRIPSIYSNNLVGRYLAGESPLLTVLVSMLLLLPLVYFVFLRIKKGIVNWPLLVMGIWLIIGLLGISFYQQSVYDHYLNFLNPVPFLLLAALLTLPLKPKRILNGILILLVFLIALVNFQKNPLLNPPNNQLKRTQDVAKFIINKTNNQDFNFALLAKSNYDAAYQFYLDQYGHKPKQVPIDKTDQLFVVCEDPCDPVYSPKYEIAAFGWTKVDQSWDYIGVKIYKLIHNPEEEK